MSLNRFVDRVVLITGGASGIGAQTARRFLSEGAKVAIADINQQVIDAFIATAEPKDRAFGVVMNVADSTAVDAGVEQVVEHFGGLDVLINNAGVGAVEKVLDVDDAAWEKVIGIDLGGVFRVARAALPHLIKSKGNIVNTSSISGIRGDAAMSAYDTAKGGVTNFTRATAVDYGHDGVRMNAVNPGPIRTPMLNEALKDADLLHQYEERIPLGRVGTPGDVAAAITFLASDDASFISGVNLSVDGELAVWSGQPDISGGLSH